MIKSTTSLIGVYDPLPSHVLHRYYKFLGRGWHAPFELPARFTRGYKHPRLFQSGGPGFWAGLGSLMRSRLIPKERPKSSGWGGHADIPENAHPRGTANPTKCAGLWNASELPGLPKLHFHSSDPSPPPPPLPCRSVHKRNRDTDATIVGPIRLIFIRAVVLSSFKMTISIPLI